MKEAEDLQKQTDSLARQNALLEQDKVLYVSEPQHSKQTCYYGATALRGQRPVMSMSSQWLSIIYSVTKHTHATSVQNIFQVGFPWRCLHVLTSCILLVVLISPNHSCPHPSSPEHSPASQWSVVVVCFHWCTGLKSVTSAFQYFGPDSFRQINIGHISLNLK